MLILQNLQFAILLMCLLTKYNVPSMCNAAKKMVKVFDKHMCTKLVCKPFSQD